MRLINADKLLNKIDAYMCGSQDVMFVKELIKKQPTAYNVDKVVEELEDDKEFYSRMKFKDVQTRFIHEQIAGVYDDVIEIVKAGGINDN